MSKVIIIQGDYEYGITSKIVEQLGFSGHQVHMVDGDTFVNDYFFLSPNAIYIVNGIFTTTDDWDTADRLVNEKKIKADHLLVIHTQPVEEVDYEYENVLKHIIPKKEWFRLDAIKLNETELLEKSYIVVEGWVKDGEPQKLGVG